MGNNREKKGSTCPVCGGDEIEGGSFDVCGSEVSQECYCLRCEAEWTDVYTRERSDITRNGDLSKCGDADES